MRRSIVLVGPMGAGKSTVAPILARRLGLPSLDTDGLVEAGAGLSIPEIFSELGEARFRRLESEALRTVLSGEPAVISVGGGAVLEPKAWSELRSAGALTVYLAAPASVLASRLEGERRPLLGGLLCKKGLRERLEALLVEREPWYRRADLFVDAVSSPEEVVDAAAGLVIDALGRSVPIRLKDASHAYWVEDGLEGLGDRMARIIPPVGAASRCALVSDTTVASLYGEVAETSLRLAGYAVSRHSFPPGERSKTLATASGIIDRMLESVHQRGSPIVALGGGVTGDLAGFVAAIVQRGCPLIQVPTTLTAMIDASIGGKTGVDHEQGKNLIGAFHQPALILAPLALLRSLDSRDYRSGLAEAVKMGLLDPGHGLLELIESSVEDLTSRKLDVVRELVLRCVRMKAEVVESDPLERLGKRKVLNLGHTMGHALERETDYERYLHGEAVGIGLLGACRVSAAMGLSGPEMENRVASLLDDLGLPSAIEPILSRDIIGRAMMDKKSDGERIDFVVPVAGGGAQVMPLSTAELESILLGVSKRGA